MRCFVPATDDEIYAYIERHGLDALVPYRVGMRALQAVEPGLPVAPAELSDWRTAEEPRRAA
ncbi:MAG: hypothetical protein IPO66_22670 [Rhodanobacteraceae bacterium]|nr:hypothetical protein [Rhodanobacteraceae bacterium]